MDDRISAHNELLTLTTEIVSSHVANNTVAVSDLPNLIDNVFSTLARLGITRVHRQLQELVRFRYALGSEHLSNLQHDLREICVLDLAFGRGGLRDLRNVRLGGVCFHWRRFGWRCRKLLCFEPPIRVRLK